MQTTHQSNGDKPTSTGRMPLLIVVVFSLIILGAFGFIASNFFVLARRLFPAQNAEELAQITLLLLAIGLGLIGYRIVRRFRANLAEARRPAATQTAVTESFSGDSIAQRVKWTPIEYGGARFKDRRLIAPRTGRIEIRAAWQTYAFSGVFIFSGIVAVTILLSNAGRGDVFSADFLSRLLAALLFGLTFVGGGGMMLYSERPGIFDRQAGWYWRGNTALRAAVDIRRLRQATELANIHALQIITEQVVGKRRSFNSYELNLVLKDGKRINVMDHGNEAALITDAETLARFLGVPVWRKSTEHAIASGLERPPPE